MSAFYYPAVKIIRCFRVKIFTKTGIMKIRLLLTVVVIMSMVSLNQAVNAQIVKPKEVIKEQGTNRINNRIEQVWMRDSIRLKRVWAPS